MIEARKHYAKTVMVLEAARDQYRQLIESVRQWPYTHDAEHQAVPQEAWDAVDDAAVVIGEATDARDAAWRAYKRERKNANAR